MILLFYICLNGTINQTFYFQTAQSNWYPNRIILVPQPNISCSNQLSGFQPMIILNLYMYMLSLEPSILAAMLAVSFSVLLMWNVLWPCPAKRTKTTSVLVSLLGIFCQSLSRIIWWYCLHFFLDCLSVYFNLTIYCLFSFSFELLLKQCFV